MNEMLKLSNTSHIGLAGMQVSCCFIFFSLTWKWRESLPSHLVSSYDAHGLLTENFSAYKNSEKHTHEDRKQEWVTIEKSLNCVKI